MGQNNTKESIKCTNDLFDALEYNSAKVIINLIRNKHTDINRKNKRGYSPLMYTLMDLHRIYFCFLQRQIGRSHLQKPW